MWIDLFGPGECLYWNRKGGESPGRLSQTNRGGEKGDTLVTETPGKSEGLRFGAISDKDHLIIFRKFECAKADKISFRNKDRQADQ